MALIFNPLEGIFDFTGEGGGGGDSFDVNLILTGLNVSGELAVLVDNDGNVLVGEP